MNYLELCNEVLVRMREDEITDIADPNNEPQQKLVTRFVQDAYDFVLKAHNWNAQRKEWKIPIIEGQNIYELPVSSEGASVYSVELKDDCNKKANMIEVDAPGMARLDECQTGVPYYYAPSRVSNGQLGIEIWPMPVIPTDPGNGNGGGGGDDGSCPCSCGEFTFDPLPCNPGQITGGLYDMADTRPIVDGVFLNSDGSQGRVKEWLKGVPSNLAPDVNGKAEVFYNDEKHFGFMDLNGSQGRAWSSGLKNYEGQPFNSKFEDTFEFCALIGYTGNQGLADPPLSDVPDVRTQTFGSNGKVRFSSNLYLLEDNNDSVLINGINIDFQIERSSPSSIRYSQNTSFGGNEYINVDLPPTVLNPTDKYYWVSVKTTFGLESLGNASEGIVDGLTASNYWIFRSYSKSDLYVNGFLVAQDIFTNYKSGWEPDDPRMYAAVLTGENPAVEPQNLKLGTSQTKNGVVQQSTIPSIDIRKPSAGTGQVFIAFMDEGPGALQIPTSEFGKNLKRIDPNHTPAEDCDCPAPPRPASLGDLTERTGPNIVDYTPDYYPVSRDVDFTFEIDFFMESNTLYQNLFTLGGNIERKYGAIYAYSTNSNGLIISSSPGGTTTDGNDQIFIWEPSQKGGVDINGTRRSIVIQKVARSVTVWLDGERYVNWPANSASEIEFPTTPFPGASLKLFAYADDSLLVEPATNAVVYGHRFTPGFGVYPMDADEITPEFGPSAGTSAATFAETGDSEQPAIAYTGDDLVVNGYGMAPKLVANTDKCEIPEQVVLYYALSLASRERGEVGGMAAAEIFALSKQYLADAIARDVGNSRHEYTWETV